MYSSEFTWNIFYVFLHSNHHFATSYNQWLVRSQVGYGFYVYKIFFFIFDLYTGLKR